ALSILFRTCRINLSTLSTLSTCQLLSTLNKPNHPMLDKRNRINKEERAVLVGVVHKDQSEQAVHEYLDELAFLAETAGAVSVKKFVQKLAHPDSRTYVGKGKL